MEVNDLDAITPGIPEIATKGRLQFQVVFAGDLFTDFGELGFIPDHEAEVGGLGGVHLLHCKNGEKLMGSDFEEGIPFPVIKLLQIKDVLVKFDGFGDVGDFDGDVVDAVNLDGGGGAHGLC